MNVESDNNPLPEADSGLKYIFVVPQVSLIILAGSEHREKCPGISVQLCSSSLLVGIGTSNRSLQDCISGGTQFSSLW